MTVDWIRVGLKRTGKTRSGLARALGRSPSAVTDLLNGHRRLRADEIATVSDYLGIAPGPLNIALSTRFPYTGFHAKLHPEILTVHAAGGADMIKAAVQAAPETIVAGVTLLTSIGDKDLAELGVVGSVSDAVRRMAVLAVAAGARGLVCSPQEVAAVRAEVGPDITLITPGIRPSGADSDDQARIATPVEAIKAGADLLVIGRPITRASDPGAAAATIAASLRRAAPAA